MQSISRLRKKSKKYTIGIIVISIIILFLLGYYVGNGFNLNDVIINTHGDCRIILSGPADGAIYYNYDDIDISGMMWGGIPQKVLAWDERYNVPLSCVVSTASFGLTVSATDISEGEHTICVQGQTIDGRWTDVERVTVMKRGTYFDATGQIMPRTWTETFFPEPIATIFRPVEEVLSSVVVIVTGGTSDDDLNGDNIPDEFQQSPVQPRHNPMNVPLSIIIIFSLIVIIILILIFYLIKPYMEHRYARETEIRRSPEQREWALKIQKGKEQKLQQKLSAEKRKRIKYERELSQEREKHSQSKSKRPVNIFFTNTKKNGGNK